MGIAPRVSIGLPAYNGARFIEETLDSLLGQTFGDFELIISDNCSTDATESICRAYAARDSRIRYVRETTNRGAAYNYNRVFELSRAPYFKWAAADDVCGPELLERCITVLDNHPEVVLCYPKTMIIDETSRVLGESDDALELRDQRAAARFLRLLRTIRECNAVFGVIRSRALARTGLIGRYIAADTVLLAELTLYGEFWQTGDATFYRREHPAASSSDKSVEAQLAFYDPRMRRRTHCPLWHHQMRHVRSIVRAPLTPRDKLAAARVAFRQAVVMRHALAHELWSAMLLRT